MLMDVAGHVPPPQDSTEAAVVDHTFALRMSLDIKALGGRTAFGPIGGMLADREPLTLSGTFDVVRPGVAEFHVQELSVHGLPVPTPLIPGLVHKVEIGQHPAGLASDALAAQRAAVRSGHPPRERQGGHLSNHAMTRRVLVVDDEPGVRGALGQLLEYEGYSVRTATNAADGIAQVGAWHPHLVFLDVKMAGMDGLEALKRIREADRSVAVVMISGHATIQTAVEATQLGAYDILEKPLDTDRILVTLRNALQHLELYEENSRLRETIESRYEIVGKSYVIRALIDKIDKVAGTPARVLISGENGTGKELVARAIHRQSPRHDKPFVEVNCAAIPGELIESELFGHMRGSFTGAVSDRAGKFEQANGGTLFLDEVGDMSPAAQAKVLRVLQDGVVTRIGGAKPISVDVRVLAATNKALESRDRCRPVPRGPLLPTQRRAAGGATSARAAGGHPAPGQPFPADHGGAGWHRASRDHAGRCRRACRPGVAGQRP